MNRTTYLTLAVILALALASTVHAVPITTFAATDGYVRAGSIASDVQEGGVGDLLWVRHQNTVGDNTRKAWIRFDLSSYNIDLDAPATLQLQRVEATANAASDTVHVHGLNAGFVPGSGILGTNWSETALTWNNAPGNNVTQGSLLDLSQTTQVATFDYVHTGGSGEGFEFYTIAIGALAPFLQPDGSVTLILTGPGSGDARMTFASREHALLSGPLLTFQTAPPIPEPASAIMLGAGALLLGLARARRRRGKA